jgi:predicted ATPase
MRRVPFLTRVSVMPERVAAYEGFPYGIPFVRELDLALTSAVTYLVGENGTGKSTLVEAIAEACGFPVAGGSRNEASVSRGASSRSRSGTGGAC